MNIKSPKIKVGFYCQNQGYPNVDIRFPEQGNPGMGGAQFSEIATVYYLNQFFSEQLQVVLFAQITDFLPSSLEIYPVDNLVDAAEQSKRKQCDILVFSLLVFSAHPDICDRLEKLNIKAIIRSDDWFNIEERNLIANCSQIKCNVCFSQEQLDHYRDHQIFEKSTRIFHLLYAENYAPKNNILKQGNTVVFLGNLIPIKGFHILARVWPLILRKKPDAKLVVIGSGKLYDRNQKLGKWGIAEENYEKNYIRPFLSDENGEILDSVHFAGLVKDKNDILRNADVGVVNPSGLSEVFCISAIEIEACGTPVVSYPRGGLLDTVVNKKTGLYAKNDRDLVKSILYLLENPNVAHQYGQNGIKFVRETFNPKLISEQWLHLLFNVHNDIPIQQPPMKKNYLYRGKILKEWMRIIKKYIPILRNVPAMIDIKTLLKK